MKKAVNTLHEEFFSDGKRQLNLYIAGVGTVGNKLLNQLEQQAEYLSENLHLNIRVVGLANSKKILFNEDGIDLKNFKSEIADSKIDSNAKNLADLIIEKNLRSSIFVDVTADENVTKIYPQLLQKSISVIACNKIAASGEFENYQKLKDLAREYNANFLFETNVGAGLPIINTLNDLTRSGDKINRIEAVLVRNSEFCF